VELLHRFDLRQLLECQPLQEHAKSPTSLSLSTAASGQLDSDYGQQMKALKLTLRGLRTSHNKDLAKTPALYGILDDPSNRLPSFFRKVKEHFDQGGVGYPPSHSTSLARLGLETSSILDTCYSGRYQWKLTKKGLRKSVRERPTFDARDLMKKYQDTVWAEDIQIERMSLCKTDRKAKFQGSNNEILLEDEYEEIASIPLPSEAEAEIE